MADLSITAASVISSTPLNALRALAGATILAGQGIYKDANGVLQLTDANAAAPANTLDGIALNGGAVGQPISYIKVDPDFVPGFTALAGDSIYCSDNPGMFTKTFADLGSGATSIVVGSMKTTTHMNLNPTPGGAIA